jgi:hypothetical protein
MKTHSPIHETDVQIEPVSLKMLNRKKRVAINKGLSLRPQKSLHKMKSFKPKTLLPDYLARKDESETEA